MDKYPGELSSEQLDHRNRLVSIIGEVALTPVTMADEQELHQALNDLVGVKADSPRRTEIFPEIAFLGGQTLSAVDLVLSIQGIVDDYKIKRGLVVEVIEDEFVPQYISAITQGVDKSTRQALRSVWRNIRAERYPKPENQYQRRMANKAKNKPTKFDPSKSISYQQSLLASRLKQSNDQSG